MSDTKQRFTTYNEKAIAFFAEHGARVKLLYEADGIGCYEVTLRGRKQCRLLKDENYLGITAATVFDAYRVASARLKPPVYTLRVNGLNAIMQDQNGGDEYFVLTRNPDLLVQSIREPADVTELKTWEDVQAFILDAETQKTPYIRVFVGYGPHSALPYRESYDVLLMKAVASGLLSSPDKKEPENV